MENIYDLAILGAGPAGICAAIYATRAKLNTIWLDKKFVQGGQIVGLDDYIRAFKEHDPSAILPSGGLPQFTASATGSPLAARQRDAIADAFKPKG